MTFVDQDPNPTLERRTYLEVQTKRAKAHAELVQAKVADRLLEVDVDEIDFNLTLSTSSSKDIIDTTPGENATPMEDAAPSKEETAPAEPQRKELTWEETACLRLPIFEFSLSRLPWIQRQGIREYYKVFKESEQLMREEGRTIEERKQAYQKMLEFAEYIWQMTDGEIPEGAYGGLGDPMCLLEHSTRNHQLSSDTKDLPEQRAVTVTHNNPTVIPEIIQKGLYTLSAIKALVDQNGFEGDYPHVREMKIITTMRRVIRVIKEFDDKCEELGVLKTQTEKV